MIGTTIGKYRIIGQLGRGAMGTVYKAVDQTLDRDVAIKVLNQDLADTNILKRFRSEATALAKLNHPEIATIYELVRSETDLLIVMELVRGETLEKICTRLGAFPADRAAYLIDKILSALEHAHRVGIVHCDIKPANVMITEHGGVKIMDFGTARVRGAERSSVDSYMMGTPAYMPPEQILGELVDGRADLYSVGVIFYRLLTGALPFDADTTFGMAQKHINDAPPPLHAHRQDLPDWCEPIVQRALAKTPADRFQTADEFRDALAKSTGMMTTELTKAFSLAIADLDPGPQAPELVERFESDAPRETVSATPTSSAVSDIRPAAAERGGTIALPRQRTIRPAIVVVAVAIAVFGIFAVLAAPRLAVGPLPRVPTPPRKPQVAARISVRSPSADEEASLSANTERASSASRTPAASSAAARPVKSPFAFDAKALMREGGKPREWKSRVTLADGSVTVRANETGRVLSAVPYDAVVSINYSRSLDPMWSTPSGPRRVSRAGHGFFGVFVERHWVSLRTSNAGAPFVVLRLDDELDARRAIAALEERTRLVANVVRTDR